MTSSLQIFRRFFKRQADGTLDASGLISEECYSAWLDSRTSRVSASPEKAFHRAISAHLTGVDGRSPFSPEEERALLLVVRRKERWPCFKSSRVKRGEMGFRAQGLHERAGVSDDPTGAAAPSPTSAPAKRARREGENEDSNNVAAAEEIFNFGRTALFNHGQLGIAQNGSSSTCMDLLHRITVNFPGQFILLFDFCANERAHCGLLQNGIASTYFEDVRNYNVSLDIFAPKETHVVISTLHAAFSVSKGSGECVATRLHMRTRDGSFQLFNVFFLIDPETHLWVVIGHEANTYHDEVDEEEVTLAGEEF